MAEQMEDIKRRIKSINSTERITNAMKLVSASKLRRAKSVFESSERYMNRLLTAISDTFDNAGDVPQDFLTGSREIKTACLVMITSSNGLCGSYNANVIRKAEELLAESHFQNVKLATIGTKGKEHFINRGYEIVMDHDAPADTMTFEESGNISIPLIEMYRRGEIDQIDIVYTAYVNTLKQEVVVKHLLPFDISEVKSKGDRNYKKQVEYSPSSEDFFSYLVPKYFELLIYRASLEAATCEHAMRREAMENANDNARDMLSSLQVYYNRARQAQITDQIIEIVAGSEAQNGR